MSESPAVREVGCANEAFSCMESFIRRTEKKKKSRLTKSKEMLLCITHAGTLTEKQKKSTIPHDRKKENRSVNLVATKQFAK